MADDNCPDILGPAHSWRFDGDDPYVICAHCNEVRDALTGVVIRAATRAG